MNVLVAVLVVCGILILCVFVWALCKVAGDVDREAEQEAERRRSERSENGTAEDADEKE